jgi:hypothetical protein
MAMGPDTGPQDEGVLRPERVVLGADALIPDDNLVRPPPRRFTHELTVDEAYRFDRSGSGRPNGVLAAGTRVVVARPGEQWSRVIDDRGLAVDVRTGSLRRLPDTR